MMSPLLCACLLLSTSIVNGITSTTPSLTRKTTTEATGSTDKPASTSSKSTLSTTAAITTLAPPASGPSADGETSTYEGTTEQYTLMTADDQFSTDPQTTTTATTVTTTPSPTTTPTTTTTTTLAATTSTSTEVATSEQTPAVTTDAVLTPKCDDKLPVILGLGVSLGVALLAVTGGLIYTLLQLRKMKRQPQRKSEMPKLADCDVPMRYVSSPTGPTVQDQESYLRDSAGSWEEPFYTNQPDVEPQAGGVDNRAYQQDTEIPPPSKTPHASASEPYQNAKQINEMRQQAALNSDPYQNAKQVEVLRQLSNATMDHEVDLNDISLNQASGDLTDEPLYVNKSKKPLYVNAGELQKAGLSTPRRQNDSPYTKLGHVGQL